MIFNRQRPKTLHTRCRVLCFGLMLFAIALPQPLLAYDEQAVYRDFQAFAQEWMTALNNTSRRNLRRAGQKPTQPGITHNRYACYGPECKIWIKKTDSPQTPYLGFIRYPEKHYRKEIKPTASNPATQDVLLATFPVTEIFRFSDNRWVR